MILLILAPSARSQVQPPPAPYPQDKLLNDLISTHPYGIPGSMASTDDGHWLLVAEGGSVAFIEAGAATGDPFADPVKRVPIGLHAPLPVGMLLDPDAVLHPLDPEGNHPAPSDAYLFIAGGRYGVWVMSADPRPGQPNQASRVDNRGNVSLSQDSRLWCSDLDILTVGPKRYLVALFSGLNVNRLRIYDLEDARAVLGSAEIGNEIAPLWNILLRRPEGDWIPMAHPEDFGLHKAFGFAITVDGHDVYAALGSHGLVRSRLAVDTVTGAITGFTRTSGPVLGTNSPLYDSGPISPFRHWGDYEYRDEQAPGQYTKLRRRHGPLFTDVKVLRREGEGQEGFHKLFAAVDHLGWMRFDLSGTWDELLAPEHQEGIVYQLLPGHTDIPPVFQSSLVESDPPRPTFVRQLAIVDTGSRVVMAAAAGQNAMIIEPMWRTEGWMLDYLTHKSHIGHFFSGPDDLTIIYEDPHDGYVNQDLNFLGWGRYGGERVLLPRDKQLGAAQAKVPVFGGHVVHSPPSALLQGPSTPPLDERQATFYAEITGPGQRVEFKARFAEHRPGCYPHTVAYCILDPDILHTGGNDAGVPVDGVRYTCAGIIHNHYAPPVGNPYDSTGAFGVIMNHGAQWATSSTQTLVAAHDVDPSVPSHVFDDTRWSLTQFDIGANLCGPGSPTWPTVTKRIFFNKEPDDLDTVPRHYYGVGQAIDLHPDLLLWTQIRTHEGLIVMDRTKIEQAFQSSVHGDRLSYSQLPPLQENAIITKFHTHPQFSNIDASLTANKQAAEQMGVVGSLLTFSPRPFHLTNPEADPELRTLVAIPANSVRHESLIWTEDWNPPPEHDGLKDHGMLRILDVTDTETLDDGPNYFEHTIYSPNKPASWVDAQVFTYSTTGRTFCFVGGLQGGLFAYELTDLFNDPTKVVTKGEDFFEEYQPLKCWSDEIECNIHGIVLDHVEWYDSQQVLEREELYVYVSVRRVGIMVLRFDPSKPKGSRFVVVDRIPTPGWVGMPIIRPGANGVRHLIVPDGYAGLRIYGYNG